MPATQVQGHHGSAAAGRAMSRTTSAIAHNAVPTRNVGVSLVSIGCSSGRFGRLTSQDYVTPGRGGRQRGGAKHLVNAVTVTLAWFGAVRCSSGRARIGFDPVTVPRQVFPHVKPAVTLRA